MEAFQKFCELSFCVAGHPVFLWERKDSTRRQKLFFVQSMLVFRKGTITMLKVHNVAGWRYGWKVCIPKQKQVA